MESMFTDVWQRKGSCIVFDQESLGPLIAEGGMVSLRQMLSWSNGTPSDPPVPGRTILVSGLQAVLDTMEPVEAETFLTKRIRPLLIMLQNQWTNSGVVFGFSAHAKAFEEVGMEEEVRFKRADQKGIRLSEGIWDGSATQNLNRIVRDGDHPGEEVTIGYYVARIS